MKKVRYIAYWYTCHITRHGMLLKEAVLKKFREKKAPARMFKRYLIDSAWETWECIARSRQRTISNMTVDARRDARL